MVKRKNKKPERKPDAYIGEEPIYFTNESKELERLILDNSKIQERIKANPAEKPGILNEISYWIWRYNEGDIKLEAQDAYYKQVKEPETKPNYDAIRYLQNHLATHGHHPELQWLLDRLHEAEANYMKQQKTVKVRYEIPGLIKHIITGIDDLLKGRKSHKYITRKQFEKLEKLGEKQVRRTFQKYFDNHPAISKDEYRKYKQYIQDGDIIRRTRKSH